MRGQGTSRRRDEPQSHPGSPSVPGPPRRPFPGPAPLPPTRPPHPSHQYINGLYCLPSFKQHLPAAPWGQTSRRSRPHLPTPLLQGGGWLHSHLGKQPSPPRATEAGLPGTVVLPRWMASLHPQWPDSSAAFNSEDHPLCTPERLSFPSFEVPPRRP